MALANKEKSEAEKLLGEALRRQARLENDGVQVWGKTLLRTSYPEALALLATANENFDKQRFGPATDGFRTTIALFDELAAGKGERFRSAVDAGEASLLKLSSADAAEHFQLALALKPGDDRAKAGLRRAEIMPQVIARLTEAKRYENSGNLDAALRTYKAAHALDRAFGAAKQNAERLQALVIERDYRKSISRALISLDKGKYRAASQAVDAARTIRPNAPEISELRQRIRVGRQRAAMASLRTKALSRERREEWKKAVKLYEKIMAIDPSVAFAVQGKSRAEKYSLLFDQIDLYLNRSDRLNSPEPFAHARQVLAAADAISEAGPQLREKRDGLRGLIVKADQPRSVLLKSDGSTRVTVYRVAQFGSFGERRLALRPGLYTAVGSRPGYRDVRLEFRVPPSGEETVVVVICNERI